MLQYESDHYIFNYNAGTQAERDVASIATEQEACFRYICKVLGVQPNFKIEYFLCDTPEEVGHIYGDDEPCNGFAAPPNKIYAVYNEQVKCIGFHEDAHLISYCLNRPDCPAIREGLAMYFDRKWWGIQNLDWCGYFLETHRYISVAELLQKEVFFATDCSISYPIMGAFTDYLIATYGRAAYKEIYQRQDIASAMPKAYSKTPQELDSEFTAFVKLFDIDQLLRKHMEELLGGSVQ